ncbi:hypothetical protein AB2B38_009930 [Balneola sp. MJW-20]|uniref:hypothetical protein n=1 Tax=Gracilimonas aurantiaca TaxID=3234185 RepID=UPI003466C3D4
MNSIKQLGIVYILITFILAACYTVSIFMSVPIEKFTADPAATANFHPFTGIVSNLGALLWCTAAVACLFSSVLSNKYIQNSDGFLISSALLSILLLTDDLFMLHEYVFPYNLNIDQYFVYMAYVIPVLSYLIYYRNRILQFDAWILGVALFFLGSSVVGDFILPQDGGIAYFIEDSLKFFGIGAWTVYYFRVSIDSSTGSIKSTE